VVKEEQEIGIDGYSEEGQKGRLVISLEIRWRKNVNWK